MKHSFHRDRIQDYFNKEMLACDVVICIFFKKVGTFTKEEFKAAYEHFKQGNRPKYLYVYFKSGFVKIDEIDEEIRKISELRKEIAEAEQIFNDFNSKADLILQLTNEFELIIPEIAH